MDAFVLLLSTAILLSSTNCVNTLELRSVEEGNCLPYPSFPINMTWVVNNAGNMKYFGGGSRYNMYSAAALLLPNSFPSMREFEFYYDSCFGANLNLSRGILSTYGFGDLTELELRPGNPETEPSALYAVKIGQPKFSVRQQVTLTDYKSFMFFANCWEESNQRAWGVGTLEPNLDEETIKTIEAHATMLGFQRENFIFFRYETCPANKKAGEHN